MLEAMDHIEDLCTYLFTALERIAAPVEWGNVDVFKEAETLLVRGGVSGWQVATEWVVVSAQEQQCLYLHSA